MDFVRQWGARAYWAATILLLATAISSAAIAPVDPAMGPIQKLFYLHLPIAINTFLSSFIVFIACVGYIGGRRQLWDDLAYAAARVTVLNGTILMITGVIWARVTWGHWWVWSPRLAFSLLLWLLYVAYLVLRPVVGSTPRGAMIAAVYGIVAFLDVPLVYLSVNLLPDVHPEKIELTSAMRLALLVWFCAITMLTGGLIAARFFLAQQVAGVRHSDPNTPATIGPRGHTV
jgi:heme exporter protein C